MQTEFGRTERLLSTVPLVRCLDGDAVRRLSRDVTLRRVVKGERLLRAGDPATHFTCIVSGLFKIVRTAADGSESIITLFGPHETIEDAAVIGRRPYQNSAVLASAEGEVLRVPADPILATMRARCEIACTMNRTLVQQLQALEEKIRVMSAGGVSKRLATFMLGLIDRFGDEMEDGAYFAPVALTRAELACLVGARVETTIRMIRRWEKAGILETVPDGFRVIDREELERKASASAVLEDE